MVTVRRAGTDDLAAIADLRRAWSGDGAVDDGFATRLAAWWRAEGERRTVWLAEIDAAAVGMVTALEYRRMPTPGRPDRAWGYLGHLFVRPGARGDGVGARLVEAVLAEARSRGWVRVVLAPSPRSVPLYRRLGFLDAGEEAAGDRLMVRSVAGQRRVRSPDPRSR